MTRSESTSGNQIAAAVRHLSSGGIAALPTETVYGLGADAADSEAVARVYAAKERPGFNPLIVHVADRAMAGRYGSFSPLAETLAAAFWPGPLTLVLPLADGAPVSRLVTAGLPTIALRVPLHPVMQAVIRGLDRGIAAPSANISGRLTPTRAQHVRAGMGDRVKIVVDGGPSAAGLESSIVAVRDDGLTLLRQGAIPLETIAAAAGVPVALALDGADIAAPGMMLRHYAPRLPVRLDAETARAGEYLIGFGPIGGDRNLSERGDPVEAAARLFDALHIAEASGRAAIAVAPIPDAGLGAAINDRLRRAARG